MSSPIVRSVLCATAVFGLAAAPGMASVSSVSSSVELISPPPLVTFGGTYASNPAHAAVWNELQGVSILNLQMDMTANPASAWVSPVPGPVTGIVDSHYLYYRRSGSPAPVTGTIVFSGRIVGVAYEASDLAASDLPLGPPGTVYDALSFGPVRGIGPLENFSINDRTLTFDFIGDPQFLDHAQLRVLTVPVPTPGTGAAMLGAGGLLAGRRRRRG